MEDSSQSFNKQGAGNISVKLQTGLLTEGGQEVRQTDRDQAEWKSSYKIGLFTERQEDKCSRVCSQGHINNMGKETISHVL